MTPRRWLLIALQNPRLWMESSPQMQTCLDVGKWLNNDQAKLLISIVPGSCYRVPYTEVCIFLGWPGMHAHSELQPRNKSQTIFVLNRSQRCWLLFCGSVAISELRLLWCLATILLRVCLSLLVSFDSQPSPLSVSAVCLSLAHAIMIM